MTALSAQTRAKLDRIAEHEGALGSTLMNRVLRAVGPSRAFTFVYSRLGPILDRPLLRHAGKKVGRFYGFPALLLATTGAKTGKRRESPLLYVRDGDAFVVVGTNWGGERHPAWTGNLMKNPNAQIETAGEQLDVTAELADEATWQRLWPKMGAMYAGYDKYLERLKHRTPRMFLLHPHD